MGSSHCVGTGVGSMYGGSEIPGFPRCPVPAGSGVVDSWIFHRDSEIPSDFRARESFGRSWRRGKKIREGLKISWRKGRKGLAVRVEAPPWWSPGLCRLQLWALELQGMEGMGIWDGWDASDTL